MNKKGFLILSILFFIMSAGILIGQFMNNSHEFKGQCNSCHLGLKNPEILLKSPDILCLSCHQDQSTRSHPSDFMPQSKLPREFPLFNGKVTCITCHLAHKTKDSTNTYKTSFDNNPYLLRSEKPGKSFCFKCHKGNFLDMKSDSHALAFKSAHIKSHDNLMTKILDDTSVECMSCHDGILSKGGDTSIGGVQWEHSIGVSHPIGIEYEFSYRKKPGEYVQSDMLDTRIRLFNGKLGCETCHDHYSKHKHMLVMDNFRSRLCLSCHNL